MSRTRTASLSALLALAALGPSGRLSAQQLLQLTPGQRVRITIPSAGLTRQIATLAAVREDTFVISRTQGRIDAGSWRIDTIRSAVPLGDVRTLEVSRGRRQTVVPAIRFGAAIGAVLGVIIARRATEEDCAGGSMAMCDPWKVPKVRGLAIGFVAGAFGGFVVGEMLAVERWEPVALVQRDRVQVGAVVTRGGGLGLGASLAI